MNPGLARPSSHMSQEKGNSTAMFKEAKQIFDRNSALETPDGANLIMEIGSLKAHQGDLDAAIETYQKAWDILNYGRTFEIDDGTDGQRMDGWTRRGRTTTTM